jgi:hypothetical protein
MLVGSLAEVFENMKARLLLNWDLRDAKIYHTTMCRQYTFAKPC